MPGLLDHAIAFAKTVLRADATADFRECIGGLAHLVGFLQAALGCQPQPIWNVVVKRAVRLAIGHTTLATAAGLLLRFGLGIFCVDLVEISRAEIRRPLFWHIAFDRYEF